MEKFTIRKLFGVLASLAGVFLISRVDLSGSNDENRGSFPHKSKSEIALGDTMAAISAILYGIYTIVMKKQVGSESRVNMPLFFGLVGLINTFILWPGFVILHLTGLETFSLPDSNRVWLIVLVCVAHFLLFRLLILPSRAKCTIFVQTVGGVTNPTFILDQLRHFSHLGHLLGICNVPHLASSRHCRPQPHDPFVPRGPDFLAAPVYERHVLDWGCSGLLLVPGCEP